MPIDARWLELLKASGWQTSFLFAGCAVFLALVYFTVIPTDKFPAIIPIVWLAMIVAGCLSLASIGETLTSVFAPKERLRNWLEKRREKHSAARYIPYMTDKDRQIIGHLLHHQNKIFHCDSNGGHAKSLIAKGIVKLGVRPGQVFDADDVPFVVPDHIWEVFEQNVDAFPHSPDMDKGVEVEPWLDEWTER